MDIIQLYQDFSVDFRTEGTKHTRPGWVNTECPHCSGNPGYHLGYNLQGNFYTCWRCGYHPIVPTVSKLINLPPAETYTLVRKYGILVPKLSKEPTVKVVKEHKLPSHTAPLEANHRRYLEGRNFDPDYLERTWKLLGTGPVSTLTTELRTLNYKHRIIIPFLWNDQQVTFDSRDITDKASNKYQACPKERELIPHKEILYGKQECWKETGILVEGPTDVWRLGTSSFAVSGIKYTNPQVREIVRVFKRVAVVFDSDPQARVQAAKIVAELRFRGVDAFRVDVEDDPGSMRQADADYLVKQLIN